MMLIETVALVAVLVMTVYIYLTWNYNYWRKQGIVQVEPIVPGVGSLLHALLQKKSAFMMHNDIYRDFQGQLAVGLYHLRRPALILRDPEIIQTVLVNNFSKFHDNLYQVSENVEPLAVKSPFLSVGLKWKENRAAFSPAFTTTRIKNLHPKMQELCGQLNQYLDKNLDHDIDASELAHRFTTDVISSCAFGVSSNAVNGEETMFLKYGKILSEEGISNGLILFIVFFMPLLAKVLHFRFIPSKVCVFIEELVNTVIEYRKRNNITENDYLQMLLKMREKTLSKAEMNDKATQEDANRRLYGLALTFFTDGFERSALTLSYALYEMAVNANIQNKLYKELQEATKNRNSLDYDNLRLPYLNKVVSETLRKYPIVLSLIKICTKTTSLQIEGKPVHIKAGTHIVIPVYALHMDPRWYPNPEKFDPERFSEDSISKRHHYSYLPFGEGPRICVGLRFALAQIKTCLANIVLNYNIIKSNRTADKLTFNPTIGLLVNNEHIWIRLQRREQCVSYAE